MPPSSRRDYKNQHIKARPNQRRSSATSKTFANTLIPVIDWFSGLPKPARLLLPVGALLLGATAVIPSAKFEAEVTQQTFIADVSLPEQLKITSDSSTTNAESLSFALELPQREASLANLSQATETFDPSISNVTLKVGKNDTLGELFTENNLSYGDMLSILKDKTAKQYLTRIKPGEEILVTRKEVIDDNDSDSNDINYTVQALNYAINIEEELAVSRNAEDKFDINVVKTPLETRIAHAHGEIEDSLFLAGQTAGLNDNTIMNMAGLFQWDVDFIQDIRKGDHFTVIYEQRYKDGEFVGNGDILAAEFHNDGDDFHAIRFVDENGDDNYYAPDGKSMKKAFLRAPIAINPRVTSNFNPRRLHPVHKRVRPHRGVDYGGPLNTPILAAGDGKVIFRGRKGGYGNTVIIQHGGNITTLYAHLNKFNRKAKSGSRVKQGQTIGYLGATGTVTAKHLHYEYRVNGVHRNPRTVKLPNAKALPKKYKAEFEKVKADYMGQLDTIKRALTLNAETESPETEKEASTASAGSSSGASPSAGQ